MGQVLIGRVRIVVLVVVACGAAVLFAAAFPDGALAGDSLDYRNRMTEMFSGKLPYFDFPFEHLPVAIVPMAAAWLLGGSQELQTYAFALAGVSTIIVLVTGLVMQRLELRLEVPGMTVRWMLLVVPLLPFILFRNDTLAILLAVTGVLLAVKGRGVWSLLFLGAGALAKIWPALWAVSEWWRGRRARAVVLLTLAGMAVAIVMSPAVQSIQDPNGVHSETLGGSMVGLLRAVQGNEQRFLPSSSLYMDAPRWLLLVHLAVGAAIGVTALMGLRGRAFSWSAAWRLMGALAAAMILGSYLFSTQFVSWVAPFAAADKRATRGLLGVNIASLILLTTWNHLFDGPVWWWGLLVARNLVLVWVAFQLARFADPRVQTPPEAADHLVAAR